MPFKECSLGAESLSRNTAIRSNQSLRHKISIAPFICSLAMYVFEADACDSVEIGTALPTWQQAAEIDRQSLCKIMLEYYNRVRCQMSLAC